MTQLKANMTVKRCLDEYFLEHRAKLLDVAAFLDRIERSAGFSSTQLDFRHKAFLEALQKLSEHPLGKSANRTEMVHLIFSDKSEKPLDSAAGLKGAHGAVNS